MPRDLRGAKGLYEYFAENPEEARRQFFEPAPGLSRRGFFAGTGLAAAGGLLGMAIPFYADMPRGWCRPPSPPRTCWSARTG